MHGAVRFLTAGTTRAAASEGWYRLSGMPHLGEFAGDQVPRPNRSHLPVSGGDARFAGLWERAYDDPTPGTGYRWDVARFPV